MLLTAYYATNRPQSWSLTKKLLIIMRITAFILLIACMQVSARGLAQTVSISVSNASIEKVFQEVKKQTGYDFFYEKNVLQGANTVSLKVSNAPLEEVLRQCFKNQPLTYTIIEKTIVVKKKNDEAGNNLNDQSAAKPTVDVHGRVVNENGEPLEGISVSVKGATKGTSTDKDGYFTLKELGPNAIIVFSGVNIETRQIAFNGNSNLQTISVRIKIISNEEVTVAVNTGYQSLSKERSAGSFSKPNMDILQSRSTSMNVLQRLDGLVAGLTVNNSPSASQNPFLIRGLSTIGIKDPNNPSSYVGTNRNPLFVVDGIPMEDVASINAQDVADITVLKDATAASIWGAKASNGVIVIATKRGTNNERIKVNYDGFISFQGKPSLHYFPTMNSQQYIQTAKEIFDPVTYPWGTVSAYTNTGSTGVPPHEMILYNQYRGLISQAQANKSLDSLASIDNVQQISDLWYRNASLMNQSISVSGGGKVHSFYGSLAYTNTQTNRPGDKNNLYKVNLRQDFKFNSRIQMYLITDLTDIESSTKRNVNIDNRFYPYQLFQDANGNNLSIPYMAYLSDSTRNAYQNRSRVNLDYNPLNEREYGYTKGDGLLTRLVGGASIKLFKGLRFEGTYSYIKNTNKSASYDDTKSYLVRSELTQFTVAANPTVTPVYYLPANGGRYATSNIFQKNWTVRNQLIYDNSFNDMKHQVTLLAGQEAQEQFATSNGSTVRGFNEELQTYGSVDYYTLGTTGVASPVMANNIGRSVLTNDAFTKTESQSRFTSYYANGAYAYNRRYSINASWRIDKSNLFGIDKSAQNRPVWSVGGKWLLSDEKFFLKTDWLNRLALRATYGITGNSPNPGTASSYDVLAAQSSNFLPGGVGLQIATPGNSKLTWEMTKIINLGLDFSFVKNRINGSLDFYSKKISNLIGQLSVNGFTGYSTIIGNFGDMDNKGVELTITSNNINAKNFSWSTIFTMAYNKNKITQINSATAITTGYQKVTQNYLTGYPAFAIFGYQYAGLDNMGDPLIYLSDKTTTKTPNVSKAEDIVFKGTYQPVWSGGLSNTFRYKGIGLTVNLVYNLGHVMRRDANTFYTGRMTHNNAILYGGFRTGNVNAEFLDRWQKPGDELTTLVPSYVSSTALSTTRRDVSYYYNGDVNVVSASFIKVRDITLSYSLPKDLIGKIKTDNVMFRLQLSNLMLWKANKYGIDPEFQYATNGIRTIPLNQKAISIGAHISF